MTKKALQSAGTARISIERIGFNRTVMSRFLQSAIFVGMSMPLHAGVVSFSGELDIVGDDAGGAAYSNTAIGTAITGEIDDTSFAGFIFDGTTNTAFTCCIAAGGLSVSNNSSIDEDDVVLLNTLAGTSYVAGDLFDTIDLEGDATTTGGGRIEIGVSYLLDPSAFSDENLSNYPPDENDILVAIFFISESDAQDEVIYEAIGQIDTLTVTITMPTERKVPVAITILLNDGDNE